MREGTEFDYTKYKFYCEKCEFHVQVLTKHCGQCNWCTSGFDHHCKWLNNCIGKKNYRGFFLLCVLVSIFSLFKVIICAVSIVITGAWFGDMVNHMTHDVKFNGVIATLVLTGILTIINLIVLIAVTNLLFFHLWIGFKGITTFEYIMRRRKTKEI